MSEKSVSELIDQLRSWNEEARTEAANALGEMAPIHPGPAFRAVLPILRRLEKSSFVESEVFQRTRKQIEGATAEFNDPPCGWWMRLRGGGEAP